jgi:hypothetical protein
LLQAPSLEADYYTAVEVEVEVEVETEQLLTGGGGIGSPE